MTIFPHIAPRTVAPAFGLLLVALLCGAAPGTAQAQETEVRSWTQATTVGVEDVVTLTVEVRGSSLGTVETPPPPATTNLAAEQTTPTARREASVEDGRLVESIVFRWTYRPLRAGTATIAPLALTADGRSFYTDGVELSVVPQAERPPGPADDGLSRHADRNDSPITPSSEKDIFLRAVPSKRSAYVHEQIAVEYQLLFRDPIRPRGSRLESVSTAEGLWKEELEVEMRPDPQRVLYNGEHYYMIVLKRASFFPTRTGTFVLSPMRVRTQVDTRGQRGLTFSRGRDRGQEVTLSSEPTWIDVRPVSERAPAGFNNAVGTYALHASLSDRRAVVGQAVDVRVRIEGSGNIALLEAPSFAIADSVDVYGPTTRTEIDRTGAQVHGQKSFRYTVVPRKEGILSLPDISFTYFDPEENRFRTLKESLPAVSVSPAPAASATGDLGSGERPASTSFLVAVLFALAVAIGLLALAYHHTVRHRKTGGTNRIPEDHLKALRDARAELQQADDALANGEAKRFFDQVEHALMTGLAPRLDDAPRALSRGELRRQLIEDASLPTRLVDRLLKLLEACDRAQFSPEEASQETMEQMLRHARSCLNALLPKLHE